MLLLMQIRINPSRSPGIRRWMLAIGLFAVLPMLAFALLAGRSLLNQQQTALHVELQQQADFAARELAREVRVVFATLESLATSDAALRGDYAALHAHAGRIVAMSPRIGAITAVDAAGDRRFSTLAPFAVQLPPTSLGEFDKRVLATGTPQISPRDVGGSCTAKGASVEMRRPPAASTAVIAPIRGDTAAMRLACACSAA